MAAPLDIEQFITECETLLKCDYIYPGVSQRGYVPAKTSRLTRYLFPMSPQIVGIRAPNEVVEFVLVANITPRTFWSEVEEALAETDYKFSILKTRDHPASPVLALQAAKQPAKFSILLVEVNGQVILVEYCHTSEIVEKLVGSDGNLSSELEVDQKLLNRARFIQKLSRDNSEDGSAGILSHDSATSCLQWAYSSGILSERLKLLKPMQILSDLQTDVQTLWNEGEVSQPDLLWDRFLRV